MPKTGGSSELSSVICKPRSEKPHAGDYNEAEGAPDPDGERHGRILGGWRNDLSPDRRGSTSKNHYSVGCCKKSRAFGKQQTAEPGGSPKQRPGPQRQNMETGSGIGIYSIRSFIFVEM